MINYNPVEWDAPKNIEAFYTDTLCGDFSVRNPVGQTNWQKFTQQFNLPITTPYIYQVHGNTVVEAPKGYLSSADAIFSHKKNTPCSVVTADCVPILLCDKEGKMGGCDSCRFGKGSYNRFYTIVVKNCRIINKLLHGLVLVFANIIMR